MAKDAGRPEAVLIAGPTASGKSAFAMDLAEKIDGVVVNADSMQLHSALRVVTARPSVEDEARVPHRLYGVFGPSEPASAALYIQRVRSVLGEIQAADRVPIFVGGTGLYFTALVEGLSHVPPINEETRAAVRALGSQQLYDALLSEDPAMAASLRPTDTQRLARALEVVRSTGRSLAAWHGEREPGPLATSQLDRYLLMPERPVLHARIERRAREIVADPRAIEEVSALLDRDPNRLGAAAKAIGVAELQSYILGESSLEETISRLTVATRRYAKRQCTWFSNSLTGVWNVAGSDGNRV